MLKFFKQIIQKIFEHKVITFLIVLVISTLIYVYWPQRMASEFITVSRSDVIQSININGKIISADEIDLQFSVAGIVGKIFKNVGDKVKKGTVLMSLENRELLAKKAESETVLEAAKAQLDKIIKGPTPEELRVYESAVENARIALADAEKKAAVDQENSYSAYLNSLKQAIIIAGIALSKNKDVMEDLEVQNVLNSANSELYYKASFTYNNAKVSFNPAKQAVDEVDLNKTNEKIELAGEKVISHLQDLQLSLFNTHQSLAAVTPPERQIKGVPVYSIKDEIGKQQVNIFQVYSMVISSQQNITNIKIFSESNINLARSRFQEAENKLNLLKAPPTKEILDLANLDIKKALAGLDFVQQQLGRTYLIAPYNGVIGKINVKEKEFVMAGQPVLSFINLDKFQIEAEVSEVDINKLKVGQIVKITSDAFLNKEWSGVIEKIDLSPKFVQGAIYYKIIISFDNFDEKIKTGMTVSLNIQTDKRENVIAIPQLVIFEKEGKNFVRVLKNEEVQEIEVQLGLFGINNVEVLEGLKEGDKILFGTIR